MEDSRLIELAKTVSNVSDEFCQGRECDTCPLSKPDLCMPINNLIGHINSNYTEDKDVQP